MLTFSIIRLFVLFIYVLPFLLHNIAFCSLAVTDEKSDGKPCARQYFPDQSSFVCVCNATYCDQPAPISTSSPDELIYYLSDANQFRMDRRIVKTMPFNISRDLNSLPYKTDDPWIKTLQLTIDIDAGNTYQTILGFGGAFTDAASMNWKNLSDGLREQLIRTYFHPEDGIGYTIGRVPIASCDFSTREYSYLDKEGDFDLQTFALAPEDINYKIPMIRSAWRMIDSSNIRGVNRTLNLFASSWSAPGWMKTNGKMRGSGQLKGSMDGPYYKTYAQYLKRFFLEYGQQNVNFWAMTIQNEPSSGAIPFYGWQTMFLSPTMQREFAESLLSPALRSSSITSNLKIIGHDDNRVGLLFAAMALYHMNSSAIQGIGTHWYGGSDFKELSLVHKHWPDRFLLATEACNGYMLWQHTVLLGDWHRGALYGHDIIGNLRNWAVGWTDWNLCLNRQGGPNWVKNFVDAPIIVESTSDKFYKQPMFYVLGHFSRFVLPGSVRIGSEDSPDSQDRVPSSFEHVAFKAPNGQRILIAQNDNKAHHIELMVRDVRAQKQAYISIPPSSILTAVWWK